MKTPGMLTTYSLTALCILFMTACDRPECSTTNPIFSSYAPESKEYREELASQIRRIGAGNLRYWFDHYEKKGDKEYINVYTQGQGLCARAHVRVTNWNGIEGLRGPDRAYGGAELSGLRLSLPGQDTTAEFVYLGVDRIND